jgi:hypothetical protein
VIEARIPRTDVHASLLGDQRLPVTDGLPEIVVHDP